jgi:hypothetical protein
MRSMHPRQRSEAAIAAIKNLFRHAEAEPDEVGVAIGVDGPNVEKHASQLFIDLKPSEEKAVLLAARKGLRATDVDTSGASTRQALSIELYGHPETIVIQLDQLGFSIGYRGNFRLDSPELAHVVGEILRRHGLLEGEKGRAFEEALRHGARCLLD